MAPKLTPEEREEEKRLTCRAEEIRTKLKTNPPRTLPINGIYVNPYFPQFKNVEQVIIFPVEKLNTYLDLFKIETKVKPHIYTKLDYDLWTELNDRRGTYVEVVAGLKKDTTAVEFNLYTLPYRLCYTFLSSDDSFGEFLYAFYGKENLRFEPKEDKSAPSTDACAELGTTKGTNGICVNPPDAADILTTSYSDDTLTAPLPALENVLRTTKPQSAAPNLVPIETHKNTSTPKQIKEDKFMNDIFNFSFGPCGSSIHMSMYGLAVKNASGAWVSYDKDSKSIMNVEVFNFEAENMFYQIPVGLNQVKIGDILIHARKPVFVAAINDDSNTISVIDPVAGEAKEIIPTKSPFGFNFIIKIVSLFDGMGAGMAPNADNPFGNIGMYMLMSNLMSKDDKCGEGTADDKLKKMLPLMALMGNMGNGADNSDMNFMNNPMMLMLMLK